MGRGKPKAGKKKNKKGKKDDKTPQELPAKKMDDMTNEELNALLIPGISMLDDDYGKITWYNFITSCNVFIWKY